MNIQAIYHRPEVPYAYPTDKETLYVKIRTASFEANKVWIFYNDRYGKKESVISLEMSPLQGESLFDYYEIEIRDCNRRFKYYFKIEGKDGTIVFLNERGIINKEQSESQAFQFPYIGTGDLYKEVDWVKNSIVYQIFPDRFYNGEKENDPPHVEKWGSKVDFYKMFGGDLKGITEKLDYLYDLGVNVIYMTPIFSSISNHKYNTKDYYKIDKMFGKKEELKNLVDLAHEKGIRVVLDGVFNHSGHDFFAFQDLIEKGRKSSYLDWYFVDEIPVDTKKVNYITFANHCAAMPKLRMEQEEVRKYFIEVGKYWIRECNIDGWRLDVCDEIDHIFLKEFYRAIKREKPEAYIVGEIMHSNNSFLLGDEIDGTMNYPFKEAVLDFFAFQKITSEEFLNALAIRRHGCRKEINLQMLNLIDSHDTPRFLTEAGRNIKKLMLAIVFQFTYIGVPYIYYGDEVGMEGGSDPDCRRCMEWNEKNQNKELQSFYKKLIQIRKENDQFVDGEFYVIYSKGYHLIYSRENDRNKTIVLINNSQTDELIYNIEEKDYKDMLYHTSRKGNVIIKPYDFLILNKTLK